MHCLMVKVWCKFEQNRTKAIQVTKQKLQTLTEFWNNGITDMLKTVYPFKVWTIITCRSYYHSFATEHENSSNQN